MSDMKSNWLESGSGVQVNMSHETVSTLRNEMKEVGEAAWDALAPVAIVATLPLTVPIGVGIAIGERVGGFLASGRRKAYTTLVTLSVLLAACASKMPTEASRTFDPQLPDGGGIATEVDDIESPIAVVPTEISIGLGGELTNAQKEFAESKHGMDMKKAITDYVNEYWVKVDPKSFASGTEVSLVPLINPNDPRNPENMTYVGEVNTGDSNYDGYVFTLPYKQYLKYLETGDPQFMIYPQGVSTLQEGTDPFKLPKQITEGQDASKKAIDSGIPAGAVLGLDEDNHFVYYAPGSNGGYRVVGELDANLQYLAYPKFDAQTLAGMNPEQVMDSVPDTEGHEKQYPGGFYVYYLSPTGELGAAYNLETGEKIEMPENLKTLTELPTKIENAESYPEVDVKDLPAFVAWLHYKYDVQAKDLKPYPFVENKLIPDQEIIFGSAAFFEKISNSDAHIYFLGMAKLIENGEPIFWSNPRIIEDGQGNLRVQLGVDAWGPELNSPVTGNEMYAFHTNRQDVKETYQIAKFDKSNPGRACAKYNSLPMYTDRFAGCMTYLEKYYKRVEAAVKSLIDTGTYSQKLELLPIIFRPDVETFNK